MKYIYIILFMCSNLTHAFSQVGVNTDSPQGAFHVNGNKGISNNVIIDKTSGNVGLGTLTPQAKVEVITSVGQAAMSIYDGTDTSNKMLLSNDADGNAVWFNKPSPVVVNGQLNDSSVRIGGAGLVDITTTPLNLTPGKWLIFSKIVTSGNSGGFNIWLHLYNRTIFTGTPGFNSGSLTVIGTRPEFSLAPHYATPQLIYLVEVVSDGVNPTNEFRLYASCSNATPITTSDLQGSYFYAVKIDDEF